MTIEPLKLNAPVVEYVGHFVLYLNGIIKPYKMMKNATLIDELNFEVFGLKEVSRTGESVTYTKQKISNSYVEVFCSRGVISIDLITESDRMVIASRYECLNQDELTYLLTRGRVKSVFTTC